MSELVFIPPENIKQVWPLALPWVEAAVKHQANHFTAEGICEAFIDSSWQLWLVWDGKKVMAVLGTELYTDMRGDKVGALRFISGRDRKEWVGLINVLEQRMREVGVSRLEMLARKGWAKEFRKYHMTHVLLTKDLINGIGTQDKDNQRINQTARAVRSSAAADNRCDNHGGPIARVECSPAAVEVLRTGS